MVPNTTVLTSDGIVFDETSMMSFAAATIEHELELSMKVESKFGQMLVGWCSQLAKGNCRMTGKSRGTNYVVAIIQAYEVDTMCSPDGWETVTFKVQASVEQTQNPSDYGDPVAMHNTDDCDMHIFNLPWDWATFDVDSKMKRWTTSYTNDYLMYTSGVNELRGEKLVEELENKLGLAGTTETLDLYVNGTKVPCQRPGPYCEGNRKHCPSGYDRMGNSEMCHKFMGYEEPTCPLPDSEVFTQDLAGMTLYFCKTPRIPIKLE